MKKPAKTKTRKMASQGRPYKDASGSITTGGVAQDVSVVNPERKSLEFQNTSDTNMRLNFGPVASATVGFLILPNLFYTQTEAVATDRVSVFCTVTGKTYTCKET